MTIAKGLYFLLLFLASIGAFVILGAIIATIIAPIKEHIENYKFYKSYYINKRILQQDEENEAEENTEETEKKIKAFYIIQAKCLYNDNLNYVAVCINYDMYKKKMSEKHDTVVVKTNWDDKFVLDCLKLLTEEEFNLLKEAL